jgi:hypothetical protein
VSALKKAASAGRWAGERVGRWLSVYVCSVWGGTEAMRARRSSGVLRTASGAVVESWTIGSSMETSGGGGEGVTGGGEGRAAAALAGEANPASEPSLLSSVCLRENKPLNILVLCWIEGWV